MINLDTSGSTMATISLRPIEVTAHLLHGMTKLIMQISPAIRTPQQNDQMCSRDLIGAMSTVLRRE